MFAIALAFALGVAQVVPPPAGSSRDAPRKATAAVPMARQVVEGDTRLSEPEHQDSWITCAFDEPITVAEGLPVQAYAFVEGGPHTDTSVIHVMPTRITEGSILVMPPVGTREGTLILPGYGRVELAWRDGACAPVDLVEATVVSGVVTPADDEGWVEGCGVSEPVDPRDGSFSFEINATSPCALRALRGSEVLRPPGRPVIVDPVPGSDLTVELTLPPSGQGGIGVSLVAVEGGVEILTVLAGTPADGALAPGDVVVALDGVSLDGPDPVSRFRDVAIGEVGSPVTLVLEDLRTVTLERAVIAPNGADP